MSVKAILFDKDGTLLDFNATFAPATAKVLRDIAQNQPLLEQQISQMWNFDRDTYSINHGSVLVAGSLSDIAKAIISIMDGYDLQQLTEKLDTLFERYSLETLQGFDFLDTTLYQLQARGLKLGVATNDSEAAARSHLKQLDALDPFCFVVGYDSGHGEKPDPGMVKAFIKHLNLHPQDVIMVGDSVHDCQAGQSAGAVAVGVLSGTEKQSDLAPFSDHILNDISDLPNLIDSLNHE